MYRRKFTTGLFTAGTVFALAPAAFAKTPGERKVVAPTFDLPTRPNPSTTLNLLDPRSMGESYDLQGTVYHKGSTVGDALLYVWQVDENGIYDRDTYRYHGLVLTDSQGHFELSSIIPEGYLNRGTQRRGHMHIMVITPAGEMLSTELFFPMEHHTEVVDPDYDPRLLVQMRAQSQNRTIATVDINI